MEISTKNIEQRILEIENQMTEAGFWDDKIKAQQLVKELGDLKSQKEGVLAYEKGDAIMTVLSGAGGDDAEDFSAMLLKMYIKYIEHQGWSYSVIHEHSNDHGGYRNITIEISGKGAYGKLKNESGVHRLVRISPFNAKKMRHTSFSMIEVIPKLKKGQMEDIPESELRFEISKSSGPGGQNVNKRETAVRVVHIPTNLSAHAENERSQVQNKEKAIEILKGKLFKKKEAEMKELKQSLQVSKTTDIEWGNQIRSYVLHPYKLVKDHRTGTETGNVESVLERGEIDVFIESEQNL